MKARSALRTIRLAGGLCLLAALVTPAFAASIDASDKYAWSASAGWVNMAPSDGGVMVHDSWLSGYAWAENIGWVKLGSDAGGPYANSSASDWGVNKDAYGNLSGYAWSPSAGWINFGPSSLPVAIDSVTGELYGYAWGENIGWIHFDNPPTYQVTVTNDAPVVATNAGITVVQGSSTNTIGTSVLQTTDSLQTASELVYTVTSAPAYGTLNLEGIPLGVGSTFTQSLIDAGSVLFNADATTGSDSFGFSVSDGAGGVVTGQSFSITVDTDFDSDGIPDSIDTDDDNDGIANVSDNCHWLANADQLDTDGDGAGNACDSDDDNDGVLDADDALPLDANEWLDSDGDGIGNNADPDDDNDGYSDAVEIDEGSDPLSAADTPLDTDGDYEPNSTDSDDDNDGVLDADDAFPLDPSESMDSDGDGIGDNQDPVDDRLAATSSSGGGGGAFDPLLLLLMGAGIGWWRRRES